MIGTGVEPARPPVRNARGRPAFDVRTLAVDYGVRRVPVVSLAATFAVCAAAVWASGARLESSLELIPVVRIASVLFAAAAATCLEDPNAEILDSAPFGRVRHRSFAVVTTAAATVALWSIVVLGAAIIDRDATGGGLPIAGLVVELVVLCTFGWFVAAALLRGAAWRGTGAHAAAVVVIASLFTLGHPASIGWLWAMPGPTWRATHEHWAVVGVLAAIGLIVLSRDPVRRTGRGRVVPIEGRRVQARRRGESR